jgi:hypothetical protein
MRRYLLAFVFVLSAVPQAAAQQRLSDALSFLLTNRSVPTGDFAGDERAAAAARDAITGLLLSELTTLPINSPASGFTYRLDPALGTDVRSSQHFGPFFVERSLTSGKGQLSVGVAHSSSSFDTIGGRSLRDGTLVATASQLVADPGPFDTETLTLPIDTRTVSVSGLVGVTDRLDVSVAVPIVTVRFDGRRVDTYRGVAVVQALATGRASGLGDVRLRAKYNVWRVGGSGLAVASELALPTGDPDNLSGSGATVVTPRLIASAERDRLAMHGNVGYAVGGPSRALEVAGALTVAAASRLTVVLEGLGRRMDAGGRLTYITAPHPTLVGVETIRMSGTTETTSRFAVVAGARWNVAGRLLLNMNVVRPITSAGLNARWTPAVTLDYLLGD